MANNVSRSGDFYEKQVLKYSFGVEGLPSFVLDSVNASVAPDGVGRYIWPAGTAMKLTGSAGNKVVPFDGTAGQKIVGILSKYVELAGVGATSSNTPVALYDHNAVFATSKIVGFTTYASTYISSLPTCKWE